MLATYYWTDEQSETANITWGENEYLKLSTLPVSGVGKLIYSSDYTAAHTEHEKCELLAFYYHIDGFSMRSKKIPI